MRKHRTLLTGIKLGLVAALFLVSAFAAQPFTVQPASAQTGCPPGYTFYFGYGCVYTGNGGCPAGYANYGTGCTLVAGNGGCPAGYANYGFGCMLATGTGCTAFINGVCTNNAGCTAYSNGVCIAYGGCATYINGVCASNGTCTAYVNGLCASNGTCTAYVNGLCASNGTCTAYVNGVCTSNGNCASYVNGYCSNTTTTTSCAYGTYLTSAGTCAASGTSTTQLYPGCNEVITPASMQGSSNVQGLISQVQPYGSVTAVWEFNNGLHIMQAVYFNTAGAPTDTSSLANSFSTFICVTGGGTFTSNG